MTIGERLHRREDDRLIRGAGRYVGDLRIEECVEAVFLRSPIAHGALRSVRLDAARTVPGVVAAWSAYDLPGLPPTPAGLDPHVERGREWPALASGRVRYAGEPIAIVLAADRYAAEDGRDAARLDLRPLPVLLDPAESAASDVRLFDGYSNVALDTEYGTPVDESVWRDAPVVIEARYRQQLLAHTSMEPRAILARPEPDGRVTVWCSHQAPHRLRSDLATAFAMPEDRFRVIVPDVGGAFGGKSQTYPEYIAVVGAARRLGRPVRWLEDRAEALAGPPHGRGQDQRVRLAADADGQILAYELLVDADVGGYPHVGAIIPLNTGRMARGAYAIPQVYARIRSVVTNTAPVTAYRGAGRPEAAAAIERTVDLLARRIGADPAQVRRRNFIQPAAFPYDTGTGYVYDSGNYDAALDVALRSIDYPGWRAEQRRRRDSGDGPPLGIGLCTYVERSGIGSEFGAVEALADGTFVALTGCCSSGQGHETSFPQVVAAALGIAPGRIRLVEGDTDQVPSGIGSYGSRSMQIAGAALLRAAGALVDLARRRMADLCGVPVDQVSHEAATVTAAERTMTLAELVAATGPLRADEVFGPSEAFPFGAYAAVVEVEPELGVVSILRLVCVDDYGVVVNPLIVDGQGYGSTIQGIGQALYEDFRYGDDGLPQQPGLLDYLLPTISELPPLTLGDTTTPNPNTPLGAKGAGEAGCIGAPPAIVNAVADALDLDRPDDLQMPLTPYRCWRLSSPQLVGAH